MALDDPAARLAELDEFEHLFESDDELVAKGAAEEASAAMRGACTADEELRPWYAEMRKVLDTDLEEPELPVTIRPWLLLGDEVAAASVEQLRSMGVTHVLNASNRDVGVTSNIETQALHTCSSTPRTRSAIR